MRHKRKTPGNTTDWVGCGAGFILALMIVGGVLGMCGHDRLAGIAI